MFCFCPAYFLSLKKGIIAPFWLCNAFVNTIGYREAEKALQLGQLYSPEEALSVNLVNEVVEPANLLARAEEEMQKWCKIPGTHTK